jgi:AraC-like DNA-binding protein
MRTEWSQAVHPQLQPYLVGYRMQQVHVEGEPLRYPFVASPNLVLAFYFRNPYQVKFRDTGHQEPGLRAAIVAPQVQCTMDLAISGDFENFAILFQPGGFYHLFGVPTCKVTGRVWEIREVLGDPAQRLHGHLAEQATFAERIRVAERLLLSCATARKPVRASDTTRYLASEVERTAGNHRVAQLAQAAGYSERQLERLFLTELGMTPKLYNRVTRFQAALRAKLFGTGDSWTEIAHKFGFYDQMHLVREFRSLGGASPTQLIRQYECLPPSMLPFPAPQQQQAH